MTDMRPYEAPTVEEVSDDNVGIATSPGVTVN